MNEAKVPDNKSDWKSVDIYIFSNGQQSSPPRKYHLMIDQLEWWRATLNFLAKSQYGSLHSMVDLYTTDGDKVETPMQLSQNMAYVAVLPPDVFIDAGYGKYLIKATRSWEKGQFRRTSNTAVAKTEELKILHEKSNSDTRAYESSKTNKREEKYLNENDNGSVTLKTIIASRVDNQPSVIVKPAAKDKSSISMKPTDKPNRSSIQHTPRRNSLLPSPPRSRKPSLKMKDTVKINTETNDRLSLTPSINKYPLKGKINKPIQKQRDSLPEAVLTKVEEIVNEIKSDSSIKIIKVKDKSSETKTTETENHLLGKNVILLPTLEKDTRIDIEKVPSIVNIDVPLSDNVNRQGGEHELFYDSLRNYVENTNVKAQTMDDSQRNYVENTNVKVQSMDSDTDVSVLKNFVKSRTDSPILECKVSSIAISKVPKTDDNVTMISKEGIVNMKLNIEIWSNPNEAKQVLTNLHNKDSVISLKVMKGSQVDIEDKSYNNKLISNEKHDSGVNHKVVVVNCACANNGGDEIKNKIPVKNGSTNFLVFLPVLKLDEDCKSCRYKSESKEDKGTNCSHNSSDYYPAKKTTSCLSLHKERAEKLFSHSELATSNNSSILQVETHMVHDKNEVTSLKRKSVAIKEEQKETPSEKIMPYMTETENHNRLFPAPEPDRTDLLIIKKESIASILHKSSSKYTQTKWCDVLLEVKLQEDGHYSFHMPTLEMLKHYKL